MKVWIDQDMCTGSGLCEVLEPNVFSLADDGLAYVIDDGRVLSDPGGEAGQAVVSADREENVRGVARSCPGACIFLMD